VALTNLPVLVLGDSDSLKQGAAVITIGNPLGLKHSVVQGIVSARRDFDGVEMIQLAIPIEPGNSGGPLLDRPRPRPWPPYDEIGRHSKPRIRDADQSVETAPGPAESDSDGSMGPDGCAQLWRLDSSLWRSMDTERRAHSCGEPRIWIWRSLLCLSQQTAPPRPYELAVTVRLDDESGAAGLVFGSDGNDKHYGFYPSAGQLRLTRFDGPNVFSWTILEQVPSIHYRPGDWNTLKVRHEDGKILCFVNDHLVIESADDGLPDGKVGLAKFRETSANFKTSNSDRHFRLR